MGRAIVQGSADLLGCRCHHRRKSRARWSNGASADCRRTFAEAGSYVSYLRARRLDPHPADGASRPIHNWPADGRATGVTSLRALSWIRHLASAKQLEQITSASRPIAETPSTLTHYLCDECPRTRTSFAPETISSKRNERDRTQTKTQQNQRS